MFEVRARQFVPDSALEGTGFEPSVPLLRKALLGVANRRRRHEGRSHLQVQVCLEWLPIAFAFAEGPRVRIRLPPPVSPSPQRIRARGRKVVSEVVAGADLTTDDRPDAVRTIPRPVIRGQRGNYTVQSHMTETPNGRLQRFPAVRCHRDE